MAKHSKDEAAQAAKPVAPVKADSTQAAPAKVATVAPPKFKHLTPDEEAKLEPKALIAYKARRAAAQQVPVVTVAGDALAVIQARQSAKARVERLKALAAANPDLRDVLLEVAENMAKETRKEVKDEEK